MVVSPTYNRSDEHDAAQLLGRRPITAPGNWRAVRRRSRARGRWTYASVGHGTTSRRHACCADVVGVTPWPRRVRATDFRMSHWRHVRLFAAVVVVADVAHAQRPVTLQNALDAALTANSQILASGLRAEAARGQVMAAGAPFDLLLQSDVQRGRGSEQIQAAQIA